jgi:hypothetical protein
MSDGKDWSKVSVTAEILRESERAVLLADQHGTEGWVPISILKEQTDGTFVMPKWIADERDFDYDM